MELRISNFGKPSNRKWKLIADIFLYTSPLYLSAVMAMPIQEEVKLWINFGATIAMVTVKAITKFTSEPTLVDDNSNEKEEENDRSDS